MLHGTLGRIVVNMEVIGGFEGDFSVISILPRSQGGDK